MRYKKCGRTDLPLLFRLAQAWSIVFAGRRGEYFLYRIFMALGQHKQLGRFPFFGGKIVIPLDIADHLKLIDFSLYHALREVNFANAANANLDDFVLLDCGAAFGQVSMRFTKLCPKLRQVIAVDANRDHCEILDLNLNSTDRPFQVHNKAISDFHGKAELIFPRGTNDTHAAYIRENPAGKIEVTTIDAIFDANGLDLALKLDIEGQELKAIAGAKTAIRAARNVCLLVELHPEVLKRNGQEAEEILQAISSLRPIHWVIAHQPTLSIDPNKPFFSQVDKLMPYDVIGISQALA